MGNNGSNLIGLLANRTRKPRFFHFVWLFTTLAQAEKYGRYEPWSTIS